jgi:hypothetical protein
MASERAAVSRQGGWAGCGWLVGAGMGRGAVRGATRGATVRGATVRRAIVGRATVRGCAALAALAMLAVGDAGAQGIALQLRPRAGDTLVTRVEQQTELSRARMLNGVESSVTVRTSLRMVSRSVVESAAASGSTILSITDSVTFETSDEQGRSAADEFVRRLKGQRVRLRLAPDGTPAMVRDAAPGGGPLQDAVSMIPATFPTGRVEVGDTWVREMLLPAAGVAGGPVSGRLRTTFRLDSLGRGGELAYISMMGELRPDPGDRAIGVSVLERGSVSGWMIVDRARGWVTDSRVAIVSHSTVTPPVTSGASAMRYILRITQRAQTLDKR